jgi:hypothetical protein
VWVVDDDVVNVIGRDVLLVWRPDRRALAIADGRFAEQLRVLLRAGRAESPAAVRPRLRGGSVGTGRAVGQGEGPTGPAAATGRAAHRAGRVWSCRAQAGGGRR